MDVIRNISDTTIPLPQALPPIPAPTPTDHAIPFVLWGTLILLFCTSVVGMYYGAKRSEELLEEIKKARVGWTTAGCPSVVNPDIKLFTLFGKKLFLCSPPIDYMPFVLWGTLILMFSASCAGLYLGAVRTEELIEENRKTREGWTAAGCPAVVNPDVTLFRLFQKKQ